LDLIQILLIVQQDTSATSLSGGKIISVEYVSATNQARMPLNREREYNWDMQIGRTQEKVSDTYTLAARVLTSTGNITGALGFYDLT
jgi:hypothetical protein